MEMKKMKGILPAVLLALLMTACACLTLPLLARYNGRRGNGSRWFFYWFYPGHLVVLGAIQILMTL